MAPSRPPAFAAATDTREVAENNSTSTVVATVTATDPDGEGLTYTLSGRDAAAFTVANPAAGGLRANVQFDYEARGSYEVVVTATDGDGLQGTLVLVVNVENINEAPVIAGDGPVSVPEARRAVAIYTADDPEGVTVGWSLDGVDAGLFSIDGGGLSFESPPDFEAPADSDGDNDYSVTVEATDGPNTSRLDVTVTVTDINENRPPPGIGGTGFGGGGGSGRGPRSGLSAERVGGGRALGVGCVGRCVGVSCRSCIILVALVLI